MSFTPEEVRNKKFSVTLKRGYEKEQVDEFLTVLADDYQKALDKALTSSDPAAALGQQVTDILRTAEGAAADMRQRAEDDAATFRKRAADRALTIRQQAQEEADQLLTGARTKADEMISEARTLADRIRAEAEEVAGSLRNSAEEERARILGNAREVNERLVAYEQDLRERVQRAAEALELLKREFSTVDAARAAPDPPAADQAPLEQEPASA